MKVSQFLKLYHSGSSSAFFVVYSYDTRMKKMERVVLSKHEVDCFDKLDFVCKLYKVESFAVSFDELKMCPRIDLYTSFVSKEV